MALEPGLQEQLDALEAACRANDGLPQFKRAAQLRGITGIDRARKYSAIAAAFKKWFVENHIDEIYEDSGGFKFVELMTLEELNDTYDEFDEGDFAEFESRGAAERATIALEIDWVAESLPNFLDPVYEHGAPSHPAGIPFVHESIGKFRTHLPVVLEEGEPREVPGSLKPHIGGKVGRFTTLDNSALGWPMLTADSAVYLVESTFAGFMSLTDEELEEFNKNADDFDAGPDVTAFRVGGFELPAPNRRFDISWDDWGGAADVRLTQRGIRG